MKYRIVPVVKDKIIYMVQAKGLFFWRTCKEERDYGYGAVTYLLAFDSISQAKLWVVSNYGDRAQHVAYRC